MKPGYPYHIYSLGDQALVIDYGNRIDERLNRHVLTQYSFLQKKKIPGFIEAVPAYASITVFYDPWRIKDATKCTVSAFHWIKALIEEVLQDAAFSAVKEPRQRQIPVCYDIDLAPDLATAITTTGLHLEQLVQLHTSIIYRVYMTGFLPGFAYMGTVTETIQLPRKEKPVSVKAGSVGIAGRQTGIYPVDSPGGWQIIGITPVKIFDSNREQPFFLQAGDCVQFIAITKDEFDNYTSRHT